MSISKKTTGEEAEKDGFKVEAIACNLTVYRSSFGAMLNGRSRDFSKKDEFLPQKPIAVTRMVEGILRSCWRSSRLYMGNGYAPTPYKRERLATNITLFKQST